MKAALKSLAVSLFSSKKFCGLILGLLVTLAVYPLVRWGGLPEAEAREIALPIADKVAVIASAYLVGQGVADFGKEKAKVEADLIGGPVER